jgi:SAM-dependent methyltransferase
VTSDRAKLRAWYADGAEWARLESDEGWLEHRRTLDLIARHIPVGSRVLDLGGGPGRYALHLAARGDVVTLVDLSPELVAQAARRLAEAGHTATTLVGDAADLSNVPGALFDAVLALGPLYHASDSDELAVFIQQIAAVLRPGGVLLAAFIPRISGISDFIARAAADPTRLTPGVLADALTTGRLSETFFAHPEDMAAALEPAFEAVTIASLRGLGAGYGAQLRALEGLPAFAEVLAVIETTATRADVIGLGWHAVAVGVRRG